MCIGLIALSLPCSGQSSPTTANPPTATWLGQDGSDRVGPSPAPGPSEVQDIHITLNGLPVSRQITGLEVRGDGGDLWRFGEPVGPFLVAIERADRNPRADLYLEPTREERGRKFTIKLQYDDGSSADIALQGRLASPGRRVPQATLSAKWVGANSLDMVGEGRAPGPDGLPDALIELGGLSQKSPIRTIVATEQNGARWSLGPTTLSTLSGELTRVGDARQALFHFQPSHDPNGKSYTIQITYANRYEDRVVVQGGPYARVRSAKRILTNPALIEDSTRVVTYEKPDLPAGKSLIVKPGDPLATLLEQNDRLLLKAGQYELDQPLVIRRPTVIEAEPGTTLVFRQKPEEAPWTSAIGIEASHVELRGFSVRFAGQIRWNESVPYGPAVIGGPLQGTDRPTVGLQLDRLDLQSPATTANHWPESVRLGRLVSIANGSIRNCVLQGGMIEFIGGPWLIADNVHRGSIERGQTAAAFSGHYADGLILRGNTVEPQGSGKLWRFLVLTTRGDNIQIHKNIVRGVGPARSDPIAHPNAPEVILTESYRIYYEGAVAGLSPDGRSLAIYQPQSPSIEVGSIVAILDGPDASRWRRVVRVESPTQFTLDARIPSETKSVAITTGFVGMEIVGNTLDCRGRDLACPLVLVGNHFGTKVEDNLIAGGVQAFRLSAAPTEEPVRWGWTHAPFLGVRLTHNRFEDCARGGSLSVEHSEAIENGTGRVYLSLEARGNHVVWSSTNPKPREAFRVGEQGGIDPHELVYFDRENTANAKNRVDVFSSTVNGVLVPSASFAWPIANKTGGL